jgi:hypothetical protein
MVEDAPALSARLLDFGLAQFEEADTLTAMGDVPGTLAYIAPERLAGKEASARSDVWAVGVMLWEALAGQHPFWGVPMPQVASTISAGAPPLATQRADLPRRMLALVDGALAVDPARRPDARELAHDLREALAAPRREREAGRKPAGARARPERRAEPRPTRARATGASSERAARPAVASRAEGLTRLGTATGAAAATAVGATMLPFWPAGLVVALAIAAALASLRLPRLALAIVLFSPLFGLGNLAEGAALAYGAVALLWLVATWSEPRRALLFCAGPALAAVGLLAALPLVAARAGHPLRRALHAAGGVLAAALVAGLAGRALPFTSAPGESLGIVREESPLVVAQVVWEQLASTRGPLVAAVVLAVVAAALPFARGKGRVEIGVLVAGQLAALLVLAPGAPLATVLMGTLALACVLLAPAALAEARRRWPAQPAPPTAE